MQRDLVDTGSIPAERGREPQQSAMWKSQFYDGSLSHFEYGKTDNYNSLDDQETGSVTKENKNKNKSSLQNIAPYLSTLVSSWLLHNHNISISSLYEEHHKYY